MNRYFFYLIFLFVLLSLNSSGATFYARASGNWNSATTWSTSACGGTAGASTPSVNDSVVICAGRTVSVTADVSTRSVTIATGGILQCGTTFSGANRCVTIASNGYFTIASGGTYIHNTDQTASSRIFNGTESFHANSTIRITKWSSVSTPLANNVSSSFGHLIFDYSSPGLWNNNGLGSAVAVAGNLTIGSSCETYLDNTSNNVNVTVGGKLIINGELRVKDQGSGTVSFTLGDTLFISGSNSYMAGIQDGSGSFTFNGQHVQLTNQGTFHGVHNGPGDLIFNFGNLSHVSSFFYGIYNDENSNAGKATFTGNNIYYSDNYFILHYGCNVENDTVNLTLTGNLDINFSSILSPQDDYFAMCRMSSYNGIPNSLALNVNIAGNVTIYGNAGDFFVSSEAAGNETINIAGNLTVSEGSNYFNGIPGQITNGHNVTLNVNGTTIINGGVLILSANPGTLDATFSGATNISNGTLTLKGSTGTANVNFNSSFNLSNGTVFLHNDSAVSNDIVTINAKNSFQHSGGVINFCNNTKSGGAENVINLTGATVSLGPSGNITRGLAGTGSVFGHLIYKRTGSMSFSRTPGHDIQQVKQSVSTGTTLNLSASLQVASHASPQIDMMSVQNGGILNLNSQQLFSNATALNSGISALSGGKIRTSHANGFYNNTAFAAISNTGNMNYSLDASSIVEIFGSATKPLTGIGLGVATLAQHKYGILEINHTGAANTTWVYPTSSPSPTTAIYIRTQLRLINGELNLINSSSQVASGGRTITIESNANNAITRTNGYIKSEAYDFSGKVVWMTGSTAGSFVIPFGYNASNYIPMTFIVNTAPGGTATLATYHTPPTNLPWPPSVNNLFSAAGLTPDNRDATADRYWSSAFSGGGDASVTMTYATSELPVAPYNNLTELRAHRYNTGMNLWEPPIFGQAIGANSLTIPNIPASGTWAIASFQSPLPVELLSFQANEKNEKVFLSWTTASEKENDYFDIERSHDLLSIENIARVNGAGNSNQVKMYHHVDAAPLKGTSYYRLKQVDFNGDFAYSEWISVRITEDDIKIYPNPASDFIYISQDAEIRIFDASGKVILNTVLNNNLADVSSLHPGIYIMQVITGTDSSFRQLVISR